MRIIALFSVFIIIFWVGWHRAFVTLAPRDNILFNHDDNDDN
jgi:hypothetical protein